MSRLEAGLLCLGLVLFLALRLPWIGHGIGWDEALNLCTTRALFAGGNDPYAAWFWRHPPLLNVLLLLLAPLREGFSDRAQLLVLGIWALAAVVLYLLNRRAFGPATALLAMGLLAVMPGARFFDVWIKQEPLLVLFGLLALLAQAVGRPVLCGCFLGLAFLSKELALFFACAVLGLGLLEPPRRGRLRDLAAVALVTAAIAGWWYLWFSRSTRQYLAFATGAAVADLTETRDFAQPWYYFFRALPLDLGWPGIVLLVAGLGRFGWMVRKCRRPSADPPRPLAWWPLVLAGPAWLLLSMSTGKAPWFLMSLYPALATLQAVGVIGVVTAWRARGTRVAAGLLAGLLAAGVYRAGGGEYDAWVARRLPPGLQHAVSGSREAAMLLNELQQPGENVLLTTYYFYPDADFVCPILVSYLKPMPVLLRRHSISAAQVAAEVRAYDIRWVLAAPDPESHGPAFVREMAQRWRRRPFLCGSGILLYRTGPPDPAPSRPPDASGVPGPAGTPVPD